MLELKQHICNVYKLINLACLLLAVGVWQYVEHYYRSGRCLEDGCSFEFMEGILDPIRELGEGFALVFLLFLFLRPLYFKWWLLLIASWAIPVMTYIIVTESVYATGLYRGRTLYADVTTYLLLLISIVFVVLLAGYRWWRTRQLTKR